MANKFITVEYEKEKKPINWVIIIISIVLIILVITVIVCINLFSKPVNKPLDTCDNSTIKLKKELNVEINTSRPKALSYFENYGCLSENDIEVDDELLNFTKLDTYTIKIRFFNNEYEIPVKVVDTTKPILKSKKVFINEGDTYTAKDFVESCTDNSGKECEITFYKQAIDENGYELDYSKYTQKGKYKVKIEATDSSGNKTLPVEADLYLGIDENYEKPEKKCLYGTIEYDSSLLLSYPMHTDECAVDPNLYNVDSTRETLNKVVETEVNKLKTEFSLISGLGEEIIASPFIDPVYNTAKTGLMGVTIKIIVTSNEKELVSFYLKNDGTRQYINNPYELN